MTDASTFAGADEIAALIDHTLLKPDAAEVDIAALCRQALEHRFASVCVNPCWVPLVSSELRRSAVRTCCVVGFPLGANRTQVKVEETLLATGEGASEIDMVINVGALRSGHVDMVRGEIRELAITAHAAGAILKVIIETCLLTDDQKTLACELAKEADADFVKTSTGFAGAGATEADVALMRLAVGTKLGVKASGGVRTLDALTRMVKAGANRIGTSAGVHIISEFQTALSDSVQSQVAAGDGSSY